MTDDVPRPPPSSIRVRLMFLSGYNGKNNPDTNRNTSCNSWMITCKNWIVTYSENQSYFTRNPKESNKHHYHYLPNYGGYCSNIIMIKIRMLLIHTLIYNKYYKYIFTSKIIRSLAILIVSLLLQFSTHKEMAVPIRRKVIIDYFRFLAK